jgi:hypothetical protein
VDAEERGGGAADDEGGSRLRHRGVGMVVADDGLRWKATRWLGWCPRKAKATAPLDPSRQSRGKAKATARTMAHAAVKKNAEEAEAGNDQGREVRTRKKVGGNSSERVGAEASQPS